MRCARTPDRFQAVWRAGAGKFCYPGAARSSGALVLRGPHYLATLGMWGAPSPCAKGVWGDPPGPKESPAGLRADFNFNTNHPAPPKTPSWWGGAPAPPTAFWAGRCHRPPYRAACPKQAPFWERAFLHWLIFARSSSSAIFGSCSLEPHHPTSH